VAITLSVTQRGDRPFVFTNLKTGEGLVSVVSFIRERGML
jgi:urease accessory protein